MARARVARGSTPVPWAVAHILVAAHVALALAMGAGGAGLGNADTVTVDRVARVAGAGAVCLARAAATAHGAFARVLVDARARVAAVSAIPAEPRDWSRPGNGVMTGRHATPHGAAALTILPGKRSGPSRSRCRRPRQSRCTCRCSARDRSTGCTHRFHGPCTSRLSCRWRPCSQW